MEAIESTQFNRLMTQLAEPPPTARAALAADGTSMTPDAGAAAALAEARDWFDFVLAPACRLPDRTILHAFRQEEGRFDVVRASFAAAVGRFWLAQSRRVLAVTIEGELPGPLPLSPAAAQALAERVFSQPEHIRLDGTGPTPPWPHWAALIVWRSDAERVSFVTLKADGEPSRALITAAEEDNRRWFD